MNRAPTPTVAVIATFADAADLLRACREVRRALPGWGRTTYTPHPLEELADELGGRPSPLPRIVFWAFLAGAIGGYAMQVYAMAITYPLNIGGRPLHSWPAFLPITFELGVLTAAITGICAWLARLAPRLHRPELDSPLLSRASQDRYALRLDPGEPTDEALHRATRLLQELGADATEVRRWS